MRIKFDFGDLEILVEDGSAREIFEFDGRTLLAVVAEISGSGIVSKRLSLGYGWVPPTGDNIIPALPGFGGDLDTRPVLYLPE